MQGRRSAENRKRRRNEQRTRRREETQGGGNSQSYAEEAEDRRIEGSDLPEREAEGLDEEVDRVC